MIRFTLEDDEDNGASFNITDAGLEDFLAKGRDLEDKCGGWRLIRLEVIKREDLSQWIVNYGIEKP